MKSKYDEYGYDEYEEGLSADSYSAAPAAPAATAPAAVVSRRPSVDAQLRAPAPASVPAPTPASVPVEDAPPEIVDVDEEGDEYEYGGYYTSEDGAKQ